VRKRLSRACCFAKKLKRYAEPAAGIYGGIYTIYTIYSIYSVFWWRRMAVWVLEPLCQCAELECRGYDSTFVLLLQTELPAPERAQILPCAREAGYRVPRAGCWVLRGSPLSVTSSPLCPRSRVLGIATTCAKSRNKAILNLDHQDGMTFDLSHCAPWVLRLLAQRVGTKQS